MTQLIYDGTFEGLLTAVFEVYERKLDSVRISGPRYDSSLGLFGSLEVQADKHKAARVLKGLRKKLSPGALKNLYWCFLSEIDGIESHILSFARYAFASTQSIEEDFGHPAVIEIAQVARMVGREKHRFEAFVRFQEGDGHLFYATIDPDYNVLPLIVPHFKRRYAAQDWLIYDTKRRYGMHYSSADETVSEVQISLQAAESANQAAVAFDEKELHYQSLWKHYFKHTNIPARKNMKLHLQHVPRRYWKYLVEKQPG